MSNRSAGNVVKAKPDTEQVLDDTQAVYNEMGILINRLEAMDMRLHGATENPTGVEADALEQSGVLPRMRAMNEALRTRLVRISDILTSLEDSI